MTTIHLYYAGVRDIILRNAFTGSSTLLSNLLLTVLVFVDIVFRHGISDTEQET